jgi:AcrR family transcriptional regulator
MGARASAVADTRRRILDAAKELHAEHGLVATTYGDVARRAGVALATIYRHFPRLEELIPACASTIHVLRPATPELAREIFGDERRPLARLELLLRGTCDCYARDAGWLRAARGEEDALPALRGVARVQRENLLLLVRAALEGTAASERTVRLLVALLDFPFWRSLRDAGFDEQEATQEVWALVRQQLGHEGIR